MKSAAIVGAGMAGLACAAKLAEAGWRVALFDKGRRPGGRMSSKTVRAGGADFAFDYGAQYMTVRDPGFVTQVRGWADNGVAAPWPIAGQDGWVGVPAMSTILSHMAEPLAPRWSTHIRTVTHDAEGWHLVHDAGREGPFDALILALPAEQVPALADRHDPALSAMATAHPSAPCWTVLLGFECRLAVGDRLEAVGPIDWAARNNAKPGRDGGEAWTIHATADWSLRHMESDAASVTAMLLRALEERVGTLPAPVHAAAHRWRYARSGKAGIGAYHAPAIGLAACGDWLLAPRVESAWLSGRQAAEALLTA